MKYFRNRLLFFNLFFIIALLFNFCKSKAPPNRIENKFNSGKRGNIIKELPLNTEGNVAYEYHLKNVNEKITGFHTLENGCDSITIRFWYLTAFSNKEQVVEFENINSNWYASLYTITKVFGPNSDSIISVNKKVRYDVPKSGWIKFINELYNLDVLRLPNCLAIPKYSPPNDGGSINVEIATKNSYRMYFYSGPKTNYDRIVEAQKIEKIMDLIENEFDFKRIGPI